MPIPDEKLEKLDQFVNFLSGDSVTKKDFFESIKKVMAQVSKVEIKALEKVNKAVKDLKVDGSNLSEATKSSLQSLKVEIGQHLNKALKEQTDSLNFIRDKVRRIENGNDGTDGVDGLPGKDADPVDTEKLTNDILDKLEQTPRNIGIEDVGNLRDELTEIRKIKGKGGGGVSAIGVAQTFKWIAHTEEPAGLIDGANKVYTVDNNIWWIAGFMLNGEQIAELPNFTFTGKTITFATAIPAAYNGKDFEIKYIGT